MPDQKISQFTSQNTLGTGAYTVFVDGGSNVRVTVDNVLNDTNNRFWLNTQGAPVGYDNFGLSFGRFRIISGNLWVSGNGAMLEASNARINGTGFVFQLAGGYTNTFRSNTYSSIAGGTGHLMAGETSFIGNGVLNTVSGTKSAIVGGESNIDYSNYCFIGGGYNNVTRSIYGNIVGGYSNLITTSANYSTIGGGFSNYVYGTNSVVAGGEYNIVRMNSSAIGGGSYNTVSGDAYSYSFIGGGTYNIVSGNFSSVCGGYDNRLSTSSYLFVGGGFGNYIHGASANDSVIAGGASNKIYNASDAAILGGTSNGIFANYSAVVGGQSNFASGQYSTVLGGKSNVGVGTYNLVFGNQGTALHNGATVLSDSRAVSKYSQGVDTFNLFFTGGAFLSGTPLNVLGADAYISGKFRIAQKNIPATASSAGTQGEFTFDSNTGYFCIANNSWKKVPLYDLTDTTPGTGTFVSNIYSFAYGAGTANYEMTSSFADVTFSSTSPTVTLPAGVANYLIETTIRYRGSTADWYTFRLYDGTSEITNSFKAINDAPNLYYREASIRVPYSATSSKTITLQARCDSPSAGITQVITGTQLSYIRLT